MCGDKGRRFIVLFDPSVYKNVCVITSLPTKRILSISQWKHLPEFYPQDGGESQLYRNYVAVTLCIAASSAQGRRLTSAIALFVLRSFRNGYFFVSCARLRLLTTLVLNGMPPHSASEKKTKRFVLCVYIGWQWFISMPAGFCRHLVGKTLRNVCYCDIA